MKILSGRPQATSTPLEKDYSQLPHSALTPSNYYFGERLRFHQQIALANGPEYYKAWLKHRPFGFRAAEVSDLICLSREVDQTPTLKAWLHCSPSSNTKKKCLGTGLSLFRWIGGKYRQLKKIHDRVGPHVKNRLFAEVCCGSAITTLSLLEEGMVNRVFLNDKDVAVAAFWTAVLQNPKALIERIDGLQITDEELKDFRAKLIAGGLKGTDLAFTFMVSQWCSFNGLGMVNGRCSMASVKKYDLWNPGRLIERVWRVHSMLRGKVVGNKCHNLDVVSAIELAGQQDALLFVDPPYVGTEHVYGTTFGQDDHRRLAYALRNQACPYLLTYSKHELIKELYAGLRQEEIEVRYACQRKKGGFCPASYELWIQVGSQRPPLMQYQAAA